MAGTTFQPSPGPIPAFAPGPVGTLTIGGDLSLSNSTIIMDVNTSVSPSNDEVVVTGNLNSTAAAGTLTIHNLGPALVPGQRFVLFNKPLPNGLAITVSGARSTWINNLAFDGSVSVSTVAPPVVLGVTNRYFGTASNQLVFSWTDPSGTSVLQQQIDSLFVGFNGVNAGPWTTYSTTSPATNVIIESTSTHTNDPAAVFFRLVGKP